MEARLLTLACALAVLAQDQPGLRPGMVFELEREDSIEGSFTLGERPVAPVRSETHLELVETLEELEAGNVRTLLREVRAARVRELDESGASVERELARPGERFRARFARGNARVMEVPSGARVRDDERAEAFGSALPVLVLPVERPAAGRKWSVTGDALARLLPFETRGGRLELELERLGVDPATGLETAYLRGRLETEIPLDELTLAFRARAELDVPVSLGLALRASYAGELSGALRTRDDWGNPLELPFAGRGSSLQTRKPANAAPARAAGAAARTGPAPARERSARDSHPSGDSLDAPLLLRRVPEPREGAFTMLVPEGWTFSGGILRIDPTAAGGPAQSIEAKVDVTLASPDGAVRLRRVPDWYFCDVRHMPAAGLLAPGSSYQGMTVAPCAGALAYLADLLFPREHPRARAVRVVERRPLPELARKVRESLGATLLALRFDADAGALRVEYEEEGRAFEEVLFTLIEDRGPLAGGQWANRETFLFRAPKGELERWQPVFDLMLGSVRLDSTWFRLELQAQLERAGTWERVRGEVARLEREMNEHRARTNAEIHNDVFLTLTGQEEYVNPHTGEVEIGTGELGPHRWETAEGDVLYAPDEDFDPNAKGLLQRSDWMRSRIRPRFPNEH